MAAPPPGPGRGGPSSPATVDGTRITLTYTDGQCRDHEDVAVEETARTVTVTVRTRTWALSSTDANARYTVDLRLADPLGERRLVDGACAQPDLAHDAVCAGPTQ